jgi:hypothetical protein
MKDIKHISVAVLSLGLLGASVIYCAHQILVLLQNLGAVLNNPQPNRALVFVLMIMLSIVVSAIVSIVIYSFLDKRYPDQGDEPSFGSYPPPTQEMMDQQKSAFEKLNAAREASKDGN